MTEKCSRSLASGLCWRPGCAERCVLGAAVAETESYAKQEQQCRAFNEAMDNERLFDAGQPADPKALTAANKLPMLSVIGTASIIHEAVALQYGAFDAPLVDGGFGYGPKNWTESKPVECMTYIDAAFRHILKYVDGEDYDPDTKNRAHHLGEAKASLGIVLDAMENNNLIDNRPQVRKRVASRLLEKLKR